MVINSRLWRIAALCIGSFLQAAIYSLIRDGYVFYWNSYWDAANMGGNIGRSLGEFLGKMIIVSFPVLITLAIQIIIAFYKKINL